MLDQQGYLLALSRVTGLGSKSLKKLLSYFGSPQAAWLASPKDWAGLKLPKRVIDGWQEQKRHFDCERYLNSLKQKGIKIVTILDQTYPQVLQFLDDPPVILFYQGELQLCQKGAIAVVGTRRMTPYGRFVTEYFTHELAKYLVIVSGLARGVDTMAHRATLEVQGETIAVLGSGLDKIYPRENIQLVEQIITQRGLILTEYPPETEASPGNFPTRNRIIAGLSKAVLVTEAAADSGSLITARLALEQGKEVFAIPGPINSLYSAGTIKLISQGAYPVMQPREILDSLDIRPPSPQISTNPKLSTLEQQLLQMLSSQQMHLDQLSQQLQVPVSSISASLLRLEILGLVKNVGANFYIATLHS